MNDSPPFPGRAYVEWITWMYKENRLPRDRVVLDGRRVRLRDIDQNLLVVTATADHISPRPQTVAVMDLVSSEDRTLLEIKGGHVGLMAGGRARGVTWPQIEEWLATTLRLGSRDRRDHARARRHHAAARRRDRQRRQHDACSAAAASTARSIAPAGPRSSTSAGGSAAARRATPRPPRRPAAGPLRHPHRRTGLARRRPRRARAARLLLPARLEVAAGAGCRIDRLPGDLDRRLRLPDRARRADRAARRRASAAERPGTVERVRFVLFSDADLAVFQARSPPAEQRAARPGSSPSGGGGGAARRAPFEAMLAGRRTLDGVELRTSAGSASWSGPSRATSGFVAGSADASDLLHRLAPAPTAARCRAG